MQLHIIQNDVKLNIGRKFPNHCTHKLYKYLVLPSSINIARLQTKQLSSLAAVSPNYPSTDPHFIYIKSQFKWRCTLSTMEIWFWQFVADWWLITSLLMCNNTLFCMECKGVKKDKKEKKGGILKINNSHLQLQFPHIMHPLTQSYTH